MAADGGGGRELLALIHQHLLRGGFARAARELQAQSGQKLLPSLSTSLEDIFTHWEKTPPNSKRRNVSDEEAVIPEKIRVPDPVSSSESSEKEEDEKEKAKAANAASLSLATNSVVNIGSSEEEESSSEEEAPAGKGAVTVTAAVVGGKAANSLHSPPKPAAPAGRAEGLSAADRTVLSNKQQPNAPAAAPAPAKAQKLPGPGKPGHATGAVAKVGQTKAPVKTTAPESSSSSSSSSESEEEEETPAVKATAPKAEPAAGAESSSEESSEDTSSEEELAIPAIQAKPAVKTVRSNAALVKNAPAAPVSLKKNAVKETALATSQAKPALTTVPGAAQPNDTSESSSSSDSEDEERPLVTQAVLSPVKPTPAASLSVKASPAKTFPLSQGKTAPKPTVPKQAETSLGGTAAPTKPAESIKPVESSASSSSEEEDLPVPISQKRLSDQPKPIPNLSQAAKAGQPEKAVVSTLKSQVSESGSSDSSDSEEESPAAQRQPPQAVKTNSVPQPTNVKKAPTSAPATAPPAVDSSDDSSEESDSEDEIVPPSQSVSQQNVKVTAVSSMVAAKANASLPSGKRTKTPAVPAVSRVSESSSTDASEHNMLAGKVPTASSQKQTVSVGKAPPANTATPGSSIGKTKKPVLQPGQDTHPSQAVPPTHAEDTSDSSSSSDSDEEKAPKQPAKPAGSLQKPGGTQPAHSSSSESSEEEDAGSQSLLTGYPVLSKTPVTPQAPKTVPPQPGGEARPGKAAPSAANSLAKGSLKAAPANSSSSDSSDSDTDDNQVAANHKAENNPTSGQEATKASNKEKVAGKTEPGHASLKASSLKKTLAMKENNVGATGVQVTPASSHALLSVPQLQQPSSGSETEVTTAAEVPAVQTVEGLEVKKKKKKEKKEKEKKEKKEKEKKKPSSTADKAEKTSKSKDKENKKQKTSQKRKLTGEDGAVGQPKEKKRKGQANEEVPKKKKKKADGDLEKVAGSKEKKKAAKKKKTGKEKKSKKASLEEVAPVADGSAEVHKKKKKKKKGAEPEGL
ncbi:treacle protein isoform X4 [Vidua macroura]|uniref:treacle protein isoform X4 n=1 Tax=Vidua macroura TaxID=187451 RepID=UPI0023A8F125|nr:treacle protein isoform X4 [Vidua macroura]